jgi:hypothetical protein
LQDQRSPSPPYRSRNAYADSPTAPTHGRTHDPNISGFSFSSDAGGDARTAAVKDRNDLFKDLSKRSPQNSAKISSMYGKASGVLKITKSAMEFDVSRKFLRNRFM